MQPPLDYSRAVALAACVLAGACAGEGPGPLAVTTTTVAGATTTTLPGGATTLNELQADIFTPSCATGGCHDDVTRAGTLRLTSAENSFNELVGVTSTCASRVRVIPSDPDASYLLHKLGDGPGPCGAIMPIGAPTLSAGDLARIREWIAAGAQAPSAMVAQRVSSTTASSSTSSTLSE